MTLGILPYIIFILFLLLSFCWVDSQIYSKSSPDKQLSAAKNLISFVILRISSLCPRGPKISFIKLFWVKKCKRYSCPTFFVFYKWTALIYSKINFIPWILRYRKLDRKLTRANLIKIYLSFQFFLKLKNSF